MRRLELANEDAQTTELAGVLREFKYLAAMTPGLLKEVAARGAVLELDPGDVLIREGDPEATEMYLLLDGALMVRSGERHISRLDQPGEIIGELAVLQSPPRSADVVADGPSRVLAIRADVLGDPEFADFSAVFYQMLSYGLANKLRALTIQSRERLDRVEHEAATDALTGLANRKRLNEVLLALAGAQTGLPFSLIMADVDHFKQYNDTHGHPMGDVVLARLANLLQENIRRGDVAARYGGEEFVVVLPNCDAESARHIAENLRRRVEKESFPKAEAQPTGRLTVTLGVATFRGTETPEQLLKRADDAMYRGKKAGRNRVESAD